MTSLAIVGSRYFDDMFFLKEQIGKALKKWKLDLSDIQLIVSGGAEGVDELARDFAIEKEIPFKAFEPQWTIMARRLGQFAIERLWSVRRMYWPYLLVFTRQVPNQPLRWLGNTRERL